MLIAFDHAIIAVRDLEQAAASYEGLLGRRRSWRGAHPGLGTENVLFGLDNMYVELLTPTGPGAIADALRRRLEEEGEGLVGIALETADAERCARTLRELGLDASDPQPGEGTDLESGTVRRWQNVMLSPGDTRGVTVFAIEHLSEEELLPRAEPLAPAGTVIGLDHVVINTADPEAVIELYSGKLGIRLALDRNFEARGVRLLFFRLAGITIEFAARIADERGPDAPDRFFGLAYQVADVSAARERVVSDGFDASQVRDGNKPGTLVCTVRSETHGVPTLLIGPG
jgi:catechol 2,3-dioxygenase-like lactoylglutathione lyase family enzyme